MEEKVLCLLTDYVLNSPIFNAWEKFLIEKKIGVRKVSVTGGCKDYLKLFQFVMEILQTYKLKFLSQTYHTQTVRLIC